MPPTISFLVDLNADVWESEMSQNCEPSRKRHRTAILASTDALARRSGSSLPGVLPRGTHPHDSIALAKGVGPFDTSIELGYSSDFHFRGKFANRNPKSAKSTRRWAIRRRGEISTRFLPARQRLVRKHEPKAPARPIHIPLIILLTKQLGYSDKALPRDLVYGMGIAGEIENTNSLAPMNTPATTSMEHMESVLLIRNGSIIKSLSKAIGPILKKKRWGIPLEVFRNGWISELKPATNFDRRNAVLSPRLCIAAQHGLEEPKYLLIGDLAKSLVNGVAKTTEPYCPQYIDSFAAISLLRKSHGPNHLRAWSLVSPHAYKTISPRPGSAEASYICIINHVDNFPYASRILAQPFGG